MTLKLKACTIDQLQELVKISKTTFVDAFEAVNNPVDFKTYIEMAFSTTKLKAELQDPHSFFFFVYKDATVIGYLKLNILETQNEFKEEQGMELERIYVSSSFQRQRVGLWMLNRSKQIALDYEKTYLWLGVWEENTKAIRFYEKHGFKKIGSHPYYIGKDKQTDWVMRFDLVS